MSISCLEHVRSVASRAAKFAVLGGFAALAIAANPASAQSADLVVNQADSPDPGPAGGVFTYTIRVDNNGPDAAVGVNFADTLPPGSTFVGVTTTQGTCNPPAGGVVNCALGGLAYLANATVTIQVILPTPGVYTNTVSATSSTTDPNTSNNLNVTEATTAQNATDMALAVVGPAAPVNAGTGYNYVLTATNNGPLAAASQTIAFAVPAGACVTSVPTGTGWACVPAAGYPLCAGQAITCTRNTSLAASASAPNLTVPAVANIGGSITGAFTVSSPLPDGNTSNNTVTATTTVNSGYSDVSITKTAAPATVGVGSNVTYTLTPRLNGGQPAGGLPPGLITVTDTLGTGLTYVSATGTGWTCTFSAPVVTCTRPGPFSTNYTNMPTIAIVATVTAVGIVGNTATISAPELDPVPANNTASVNVTGSNSADLAMAKTVSQSPVVPGYNFTYTLTASNTGPAPVAIGQTVTVTDTIPAGISVRAAVTGTGWTCTVPGAPPYPVAGPVTVTCTRTLATTQASGSSFPAITVPVVATVGGTTTNTACVALTGTGPSDGNAANNCANRNVVTTDPALAADLRVVSKTASPNPVQAGQDLTYVITVQNNGPGAATNVTVTDTLASLVATGSFQSASATGPAGPLPASACTPNSVTNGATINLSCNVGSLASGETATVTVVVRPSIAATGNRTNNAVVNSPDVGDPDRTNNTLATAISSVVTAIADVTVTKTDTPDPVQAGTPLTYVITARNNGPSTAATVVVTDTLPANAAFLSLSGTTGSPVCVTPAVNSVGGTITCTWASIASGVQQTATVVVRPQTSAVSVQNGVAITTTTAESNSGNNSATATTAVTNAAVDLVINKVDSVDPVALGQTTKYTITVTNGGPSFATNVVMTDTFPAGAPTATFSYQGNLTVSGGGSCTEPALNATSGTLTCTFAGLASGSSVVVTYDMRAESIAGGTSGTTFNSASVTANEPETQASNNSTTHSTTSRQAADLALTKSAPATVIPGSALAWTLNVTNNGPATSNGAQVTDTLPAGVTFVSASPGCAFATGTVTCTLGTLVNGAGTSLTINVTVNAPYTGANPLVNSATVTTVNEIDTVPANNTGSASTTVTAQADLAITKTVNNATPTVGSNVTFTLTATNNGPNDAIGAQVSDLLPVGYAFVSATPSVGSYASGTGVWTIGALANGASATLTISATVLAGGPYLNSASVTATTQDPNPNNNNASASTTPVAQADLQVAKTVSNGAPNVGTNVTFTITVTNNGPSSAAGVQVTDVLPAGYTFVSATPGVGSYDSGTGVWSGIGTLAAGGNATLAITATVLASGPYLNMATGTATTPDPNPNNNTASAGVAPVAVASLAVTKTDNSASYTPGGTGTYIVVVTNGGPSAAAAVTVSDTLPAGVTLGGTVTCVAAGAATCGTVTGTSGQSSFGTTGATIAAGAGHSLTFTVPVAYASSLTTSPLVNTATATDPASPNASGSDSSTRLPSVALVVAKTDGSSTYTPGGTATYVVTVTNTGPTDAANVTVTDVLPAGLTLTAAVTCTGNGAATCGTVTGGNGQTSFGTTGAALGAGPGDSLVFTVPVAFAAGMTANPLVNTATATDVATGATANGSDSDTLAAQVSLSIVKTDGSGTYTPGGTGTYTVTITNGGLSTANNVTVADALPAGVTLTATVTCVANGASNCGTVNGTTGQPSFGATGAVIVSGAGNTLVFTVPVAFAAGMTADPLVNTATATDVPSGATGSGSDSNVRSAQVTLTVVKTDNNATYTPGGTATYLVTVRNTGTSDALNVSVSDALPFGVTLNAAVTCAANGIAACGTVTGIAGQTSFVATNAGIGAGAANSLVFTVPVAFAANLTDNPLVNTATATDLASGATGSGSDSNTRNPRAGLDVTKTDGSATYTPGGTGTYTIVVINVGPSPTLAVTVNDPLPAGVTLAGAVTCVAAGNANCGIVLGSAGQTSFNATGAAVGAGAGDSLTFRVPVAFSVLLTTDPLVNTVTVTDLPSGASASASDSNGRSTIAAALTKTISPATIAPGATATLTLTLGNGNATPLTLTAAFLDTMPAGVTTTSGNAGTCTGVTVASTQITMAAGAPIPSGGCTIVVTITSSTPGTVTNTTSALQTNAGTTPPASAPLTVTPPVIPLLPTLAKSIAPATIAPGGTATLTITLGNGNATPLTLTAAFTDTMPAGVTTTSGNAGTCTGVTVASTQITMAAGAPIPSGGCTIVVTITSSTPGTVTNTTSALQTNAGTTPPASAPLTVTPPVIPLLPTLAKSIAPATIAPGGTATLTITLGNGNATPLTLTAAFTDTMPAGVTTTSGNAGTCTGVTVASTQITMAAGARIPSGGCTIVVTITSSTPGTVTNTTSALQTNAGTTPPASAPLTVTPPVIPLLPTLAKSIAPATIAPGDAATLTITLGNGNATPLTLTAAFTDTMPAGVTTTSGNAGTCTGVTVASTQITMAAGAPIPSGGCTIVVTITSSTPGTVTNTTSALQTNAGTTPPASAPLTVTPPVIPLLPTLAKSIAPATIAPGATATLTLTLGNGNATPLTLTAAFPDTMPAGVTTTSGNAGTCTGVTVASTQITMAAGAPIPSGGCTIVVTITSSTPGTVTNTTSALQTNAGTTPPGSAPLTVVTATADLAITKTNNATSVAPGSAVTYTIVVTNNGPSAVVGATVTDVAPAALTGVTWTCTASAGNSCPASGTGNMNASVSLVAGGTATFTLTGTLSASATGELRNAATIAPPPGIVDNVPGNDSATDSDPVVAPMVDLAIVKQNLGAFSAGQVGAQYAITVSNVGVVPSSGMVSITDVLPAGLTATSIGGSGWTCTQPAGPCSRSDPLAPGASYPVITLTVDVATNPPSPLVNVVKLAGGGDLNGANNTAQNVVNIGPAAPGPEPIPAGSPATLALLAALLALLGGRQVAARRRD